MTMINGLNELRGEFVRLAAAEEHPRPRTPRRRRGAYFTAALLACVALIGAIVVATDRSGSMSSAGVAQDSVGSGVNLAGLGGDLFRGVVPRQGSTGTDPNRGLVGAWSALYPLPGGRRVSLGAAEAALGVAIPVAQDRLANSSRMGPITLVTGGRVDGRRDTFVAITYPKSQVAIEYETPVPYPDPLANYKGYVAEDQQAPLLHHLAFVGSVGGRPALVIRFHADSPRTNPASVEFVDHRTRIAVIGYQPAAALLRVANSIVQPGG